MCKLLGDKCFSAKKRKTNKKRGIATDDNSPFRWYFFHEILSVPYGQSVGESGAVDL